MSAIVAVVGRPNVGKSTLVNRLSESRRAIVDQTPGVTRDRNYVRTEWRGREMTLVDTGGIRIGDKEPLNLAIKDQALAAVDEADAIVFLVDGASGVTAEDSDVAAILRRSRKKVLLAVNKADDPSRQDYSYPFYQLGMGEPYMVSALHGLGTGELLDAVYESLPKEVPTEMAERREIAVAIVGRPNSGKSTLLNKISGFPRSAVGEAPGTTRDAVDTVIRRGDKAYRLVDTAGLRKVSKLTGAIEYYGILRAIRAIEEADVAVLVVDSKVGITDQDQKIAAMAAQRGCALIILLNKWDLLDAEEAEGIPGQLGRKLQFVEYALVLKASANTGRGLGKFFAALDAVVEAAAKQVSTANLNRFLQELREKHLPSKRGKTLKLKYATQVAVSPPTFLFFVNDPRLVDNAYRRYLDKAFRARFGLRGTPVRFRFRTSKE